MKEIINKKEYSGRERVLAALNHQESDRIPIDMGGLQSGIHIKAYKRLRKEFNLPERKIKYYDFSQQIVIIEDEILEAFHIDTRYLHPKKAIITEGTEPNLSEDGKWRGYYDQFGVFWGNKSEKPIESNLYYDPVIFPLENCKSVEDVLNYDWPQPPKLSDFENIKEQAEKYHKQGFTVSSRPLGNTFEYTTFLFGFVKALKWFRRKPEIIIATMEKLEEYWEKYVDVYFRVVGKYLDIACINGDLAQQNGPIINPKAYEQYVKPLDKKFAEYVKEKGNVKINYHCCGSTIDFIPAFIDIGYDAYNPVQLGAEGMNPPRLKKIAGDKLTLWGGLCNTRTLAFGTIEEIKNEVKKNISIFKKKGGYIASNIHNITSEVPPENIIAMFKAAYEYGKY